MDISKIKTLPSEPITITFQGENLVFVVNRAAITAQSMSAHSNEMREEGEATALTRFISSVILSWDMTSNGEPVEPTNEDIVGSLPFELIIELYKAIMIAAGISSDPKQQPKNSVVSSRERRDLARQRT